MCRGGNWRRGERGNCGSGVNNIKSNSNFKIFISLCALVIDIIRRSWASLSVLSAYSFWSRDFSFNRQRVCVFSSSPEASKHSHILVLAALPGAGVIGVWGLLNLSYGCWDQNSDIHNLKAVTLNCWVISPAPVYFHILAMNCMKTRRKFYYTNIKNNYTFGIHLTKEGLCSKNQWNTIEKLKSGQGIYCSVLEGLHAQGSESDPSHLKKRKKGLGDLAQW